MLMATYALATIATERRCTRGYIDALRHALAQPPSPLVGERAERLMHFAEYHQRVRLDNCLLPALRAASAGRASALQRLDALVHIADGIVPRLRATLCHLGSAPLHESLGAYCGNVLERLDCEESTVLPLAQQLLSPEAWFQVGAEFLRQDARAGAAH